MRELSRKIYTIPFSFCDTVRALLCTGPGKERGMNDNIKHPAHYTDGGIETIDFIRAKLTPEEFAGYCKGNALKYISRAGKKGDAAEDLAKAKVYLEWAVGAPAENKKPEPKSEQPKKKTKIIDHGKIVACYKGGRSVSWIADDMKIAPQTVINHLEKEGIYKKI